MANLFKYTFFIALNLSSLIKLSGSDDSTLYVKTTYQHEIVNGRNTARKFAIKQEMRNSENTLFREVFYNKKTKQAEYNLYYFYNKDNSIRLIEKTNLNDEVIEYYKYKYKKNKINVIEHFDYSFQKGESILISAKNYKYKKGVEKIYHRDSNNNLTRIEETTYRNHNKISSVITNLNSDSIYKIIEQYEFENSEIKSKKTESILANSDTIKYFDEYIYDDKRNLKQINTFKGDINAPLYIKTKFEYFPGGSLKDKQVIKNKTFFLEHLSITLKVYYRELPYKTPLF